MGTPNNWTAMFLCIGTGLKELPLCAPSLGNRYIQPILLLPARRRTLLNDLHTLLAKKVQSLCSEALASFLAQVVHRAAVCNPEVGDVFYEKEA